MDDWGYDTSKLIHHSVRLSPVTVAHPRSPGVDSSIPLNRHLGGQDGFLTVIKSDGRSAAHQPCSEVTAMMSAGVLRYLLMEIPVLLPDTPVLQQCLTWYAEAIVNGKHSLHKWINQTVYGDRLYIGGTLVEICVVFDAFVMKFGQLSLVPSFSASPVCGTGEPNLTVNFTGNDKLKIRKYSEQDMELLGWALLVNDTGAIPMVVSYNYTSPGTQLRQP